MIVLMDYRFENCVLILKKKLLYSLLMLCFATEFCFWVFYSIIFLTYASILD